jgi:uncharacterized protein YegL
MAELKQETFDNGAQMPLSAPNEPHVACVLLLDTSGSMHGQSINSLNKAVNDFKAQTELDELAQKRVDISIIEFNSKVNVVQDFVPLPRMEPVRLEANGMTSMGMAIDMAIDKIKERMRFYASMGTPNFPGHIFMITDGAPTDDITAVREKLRLEQEEKKKIKFFAIGVPGYDKDTLKSLTKRCIELENSNFEGIFNWISKSMVQVSVSRVGQNPQLPDLPEGSTVVPSDW